MTQDMGDGKGMATVSAFKRLQEPRDQGLVKAVGGFLHSIDHEERDLLERPGYARLHEMEHGNDPAGYGHALAMLHQTLTDIALCSGTAHPNYELYEPYQSAALAFRRAARDARETFDVAGAVLPTLHERLSHDVGQFLEALAVFADGITLQDVDLPGARQVFDESFAISEAFDSGKLKHDAIRLEHIVSKGFAALGVPNRLKGVSELFLARS